MRVKIDQATCRTYLSVQLLHLFFAHCFVCVAVVEMREKNSFFVVFRNSHVARDWWLEARCLNWEIIEGSTQKWKIITCSTPMQRIMGEGKVSRSDFQVSIAWVIIGNWNLISLRLSPSEDVLKGFKAVKSNFKALECNSLNFNERRTANQSRFV